MIPGSLGAMAMSPMDVERPSRSNTGDHVVPLFIDRKMPPPAVPTKIVVGCRGTASMSSMRPPNDDGPMERHGSFGKSWAFDVAACITVMARPTTEKWRIEFQMGERVIPSEGRRPE